eukprot:m.55094 g.55094  ORF g.55094 m.55094 type:complete len:396 (-) comp11465_c2_seq1:156-1343(-)
MDESLQWKCRKALMVSIEAVLRHTVNCQLMDIGQDPIDAPLLSLSASKPKSSKDPSGDAMDTSADMETVTNDVSNGKALTHEDVQGSGGEGTRVAVVDGTQLERDGQLDAAADTNGTAIEDAMGDRTGDDCESDCVLGGQELGLMLVGVELFIQRLAKESILSTEISSRACGNDVDVVSALRRLHLREQVSSISEHLEYAKTYTMPPPGFILKDPGIEENYRLPVPQSLPCVLNDPTLRQKRPDYIPSHLPEYPDPHTFVRTAVYVPMEASYGHYRLTRANQARASQCSLIKMHRHKAGARTYAIKYYFTEDEEQRLGKRPQLRPSDLTVTLVNQSSNPYAVMSLLEKNSMPPDGETDTSDPLQKVQLESAEQEVAAEEARLTEMVTIDADELVL